MAISITKPTVGGSENQWGAQINAALDQIVNTVNGAGGGPDLSAVTADATELNVLDGITATTAELNILDGVTSDAAEINLLDGSVAATVVNSKAVVYGAAGEVAATTLDLGAWTITETGGSLVFSVGGVAKGKLDASGNFTVTGDITAFGTI